MAAIQVLHIDDDPEIRAIVEDALGGEQGFVIRSLASCREALDATRDWLPDLLLIEVNMPGMDGPTILARLQERSELAGLPAVFLTGYPDAAELTELLASGTAGVIAKPINPLALPAQLHAVVYRSNRKLHEAFRRAEERSALAVAIIESSDDAVIAKNIDGTILSWNRGAERLFQYAAEEIVGRNIRTLIPLPLQAQEDYIIGRILEGELIDHFETIRLRKDGTAVDISLTVSPIRDKAGCIIGASKVARDISERKAAEQANREFTRQLEQQAAQLRMTNRELDEFAFAAAHDLKAPLRVIDNASRWIEEDLGTDLSERTRRAMQLLRNRVARMAKLLDDLLQYSRIGRTTDAVAEIIAGGELIENVIALLAPSAGFSVETDQGFADILVSRMPLQQILMNLIGNAIKHHDKPAGVIRVTAEQRGAEQVFSVSDDGPGIPAAFHDKIFQVFTTLKPRDQVEGSGMGLAIVRKQIERCGGSLALQSAEGEGSIFRFTLPAPALNERRAS